MSVFLAFLIFTAILIYALWFFDYSSGEFMPLIGGKGTYTQAEADLLAADQDRERVGCLLTEAFAEGRLTEDEHSHRVEKSLKARSIQELQDCLDLLPQKLR